MPKKQQDLIYGKLLDLFDLALDMQQSAEGVSLNDIMQKYDCKRRTAERMRDALERIFFLDLEEVPTQTRIKRWRLTSSGALNRLIGISSDELATLDLAVDALEKQKLNDKAKTLKHLVNKIKNLIPSKEKMRLDVDAEELIKSEGFASRPGPKLLIDQSLLLKLREALLKCQKVRFDYEKQGKFSSRVVCPYGFLYGERNHYLIAKNDKGEIRSFILTSISNIEILNEVFEIDPDFNLKEYAAESFGAFHGKPINFEWRFKKEIAREAGRFSFHPSQKMIKNPDGSLTVKMKTSGILEMAWHLKTWGDSVEVIKPADFWQRAEEAQNRFNGLDPSSPTD
ncbi:MAG: WYL domain-containing protein [Alphaproteobacteria bacterium]|nr:WYL domain-containing protein [Alphaproteobacteria bacterium]